MSPVVNKVKKFFGKIINFIQDFFVIGRSRSYILELERELDEVTQQYVEDKNSFLQSIKDYTFLNIFHIVVALVFYASIVTSVTAAIGFELNLFQELYSVLGFTTVAGIYFVTLYFRKLALIDINNRKMKVISDISIIKNEEYGE